VEGEFMSRHAAGSSIAGLDVELKRK
jgi:hypothetical protein